MVYNMDKGRLRLKDNMWNEIVERFNDIVAKAMTIDVHVYLESLGIITIVVSVLIFFSVCFSCCTAVCTVVKNLFRRK